MFHAVWGCLVWCGGAVVCWECMLLWDSGRCFWELLGIWCGGGIGGVDPQLLLLLLLLLLYLKLAEIVSYYTIYYFFYTAMLKAGWFRPISQIKMWKEKQNKNKKHWKKKKRMSLKWKTVHNNYNG